DCRGFTVRDPFGSLLSEPGRQRVAPGRKPWGHGPKNLKRAFGVCRKNVSVFLRVVSVPLCLIFVAISPQRHRGSTEDPERCTENVLFRQTPLEYGRKVPARLCRCRVR